MATIELEEAQERYPGLDFSVCGDSRHDADEDEAVAVIETRYDIYAVCDCCLARIENARERDANVIH